MVALYNLSPLAIYGGHSRQHKTNILDLSQDVLESIFDNFKDEESMSKGKVEWWCSISHFNGPDDIARRENVCNLRLVCRRFNELASSLLFPVLCVELDEPSLDRVEKISQSPHLAATIYGIQVVLPKEKELATNLLQYRICRQEDLKMMIQYCARNMRLGVGSCSNAVPTCPDRNDDAAEERIKYQQILLECYSAYQKKHKEQLRLISDGSFANRLAVSMTRMTHAVSLGIIDAIDCWPTPYFEDPTLLSTDKDHLRRLMLGPHYWTTIENLEGLPELVPARLLLDLPISIHRAGVRVRDVDIACFPRKENQSLVFPDRQVSFDSACSDLHAAVQSISRFGFGSEGWGTQQILYESLPVDQRRAMDMSISAPCSAGEILKRSHSISVPLTSMTKTEEKSLITSFLQIGGGAAVNSDELEKFCNGLRSGIIDLYLYQMELSSGSWAGTLDILRDKFETRVLEGRCRARLVEMTGGEFGKKDPWDVTTDFSSWLQKPEPSIVLRSIAYISGMTGMTNPARKNMV
ncbi:hypothetical protein BKA64DRAFT_760001 [Cadophora sp. MPI-SDFR-AT-0126]|nr:hypothetical protein BKA64DRAFT_760001 [Leotiomycetes sp. MPI-SDFR-AT-0126]